MIELIFVIVIIGILAAVAIPKMANTSKQALQATMKSYVATLNNTVGPTMWMDNNRTAVDCSDLATYIALPDGVTQSACVFSIADSEAGTITNVSLGSTIEAPSWTYAP